MIIRNLSEEQLNQLKLIAERQGYRSLNEFMLDQIDEIIALDGLEAAKYFLQPAMNTLLERLNALIKVEDPKLNNIYGQVMKNAEMLITLFEALGLNGNDDFNFSKPNE